MIGLKSNNLELHFSSKPIKDSNNHYHYSKQKCYNLKKGYKCDNLDDNNKIIQDILNEIDESSLNKYLLLLVGTFASKVTSYVNIYKYAIKFLYWIYPRSNKIKELFDTEFDHDALPNPNIINTEYVDLLSKAESSNLIYNSFINQIHGKGRTAVYALLWNSSNDNKDIRKNIRDSEDDSIYSQFINHPNQKNAIDNINNINIINLFDLASSDYIQALIDNKVLIESCVTEVEEVKIVIDKDNIFKQEFPYLAQIEQFNENQKIIAFIKILLSHGLKEFILKNISNDGTVNLTGSKDFLNNFEIDLLIDITINPAELINQLKK